jgi:hypothetical protein
MSRGKSKSSIALTEAMYEIAEATQPITGRGIGYKLFARGLIPSMSRNDMQRVYRLLKVAREEDEIPWEWIVDETREFERTATWEDPDEYAREMALSYRRDFWNNQEMRCEIWSEKGTIRGVLQPVLEQYAVGFRVMHGFSSTTVVHDISEDIINDDREILAIYIGDYDPSGLFMSERDLPERLMGYGGDHVTVTRFAITSAQIAGLLSFPASDKRKDPRYRWFVQNYGDRCWEVDALDPRDLRAIVEQAIKSVIDQEEWDRYLQVNEAEQTSMRTVIGSWTELGFSNRFTIRRSDTGIEISDREPTLPEPQSNGQREAMQSFVETWNEASESLSVIEELGFPQGEPQP